MPQICCRCAENPPQGYDEIKVIQNLDWTGKRWNTWVFRFPYCASCFRDLKKRRIFKGKARAASVSNVMSVRYGRFLRKKLEYVIFDFKNEKFGALFKQVNKDFLFDKVFSELKSKKK